MALTLPFGRLTLGFTAAQTPELLVKPPELPSYLDWDAVPAELQRRLGDIAAPVASSGKVSAVQLQATIAAHCAGQYLGLRVLAELLKRDSDDLRKRTLSHMVREGRLQAAYSKASDPRQAYTSPNSANRQGQAPEIS